MGSMTTARVIIEDFAEDENGMMRVSARGSSWRGSLPEAIGSAIGLSVLRVDRAGLLALAFAVRAYHVGDESRKFVAVIFQRLIRAEAGAKPEGFTDAIQHGEMHSVYRYLGECV